MKKEDSIWRLVEQDIIVREEMGHQKYKGYLTKETKLDMLQNAYEEALDLVVYLRCEIEKKKALPVIQI